MTLNRERKLRGLENNILQPLVKGSTQLDAQHIPDAEYRLFQEAQRIAREVKYADLTPSEKHIHESASKRLRERIFDLFTEWIEHCVCLNNDMAKTQFNLRFAWFMRELLADSAIWIEGDKIEAKHEGDNDSVDYVDEYYKTQPDHYTEASWDKFEHKATTAWIKWLRETGKLDEILKENREKLKEEEQKREDVKKTK